MNTYYITFGHGQPNFPGCVKVEAESEFDARLKMCAKYGTKWAFIYKSLKEVHKIDQTIKDWIV